MEILKKCVMAVTRCVRRLRNNFVVLAGPDELSY